MRDERAPSWDLRAALIRATETPSSPSAFPCREPGCQNRGTYGKAFCGEHILRWPYAAALRQRVDKRAAELARRTRLAIVAADVAAVLRYDLGGSSTVANLVRRTSLPAWAVRKALRMIGARAAGTKRRRRKPGRKGTKRDPAYVLD